MQRIGAAMLSGTLISAMLYPLDSLKRISQLNGGRAAIKLYKSDAELGLKVPKEIGSYGLYKGVIPFTVS